MNKRYMSDTYLIGVLLAIVGGYLDAYTYIARGEVFANAQTGNVVMLGINLAKGNFSGAAYYLIPIMAFAFGIVISELIKVKYKEKTSIHWRQITLFIEIVALGCAAFIPDNVVANTLVSFVCSVQVQAFRKVNGNVLSTTMCTGNLRSATESLFYGIKNRKNDMIKKSIQYYGIIWFFIMGAAIGACLTSYLNMLGVLFPCIVLVICLLLLFFDKEI